MSLTISCPMRAECASDLLHIITCSSCSVPIPLVSLGDHICHRPSRATGSRSALCPIEISNSSSRPSAQSAPAHSSSRPGLSEPSSSSSANCSTRPSAGCLGASIEIGTASASGLCQRPPSLDMFAAARSAREPMLLTSKGNRFLTHPSASSLRTPSPTNPFFPHHNQGDGVVFHALGSGMDESSRREGPYPTDRPLPAGLHGPGLQEGVAVIASIGVRVSGAAAWGVRTVLATAQMGPQRVTPVEQTPLHQAQAPRPSDSPSPSTLDLPVPVRHTESRLISSRCNGNGNTISVPRVTTIAQRRETTITSFDTGNGDNISRPHVRFRIGPEPRSTHRQGHSNASKCTKHCHTCLQVVGGSKRFIERDGMVLCEKDWKKLYLPKCRRCQQPIEKSAVSSSDGQLEGKWHKKCFSCTKCGKPCEGDSFYVFAGTPWCRYHYHEKNGTLCASSHCRQPIEGRCLISKDRRYHPGHLN